MAMWRSPAALAVTALLSQGLISYGADRHAAVKQHRTVADITGEVKTLEVLEAMRQKRRLPQDTTSLLIKSTRTLSGGRPAYEILRLLVPDRFQRVAGRVYTVNGDRYWQAPPPSAAAAALAERNTRARFAEVALLYLLRGLPGMPLRVRESTAGPDRRLEFEGPAGFRRVLVVGGDLLIKEIQERGTLSQGGGATTVLRRLTVERYLEVDGTIFPERFTERIGSSVADIRITELRVNEDVSAKDFDRPSGQAELSSLR